MNAKAKIQEIESTFLDTLYRWKIQTGIKLIVQIDITHIHSRHSASQISLFAICSD
jgi:hypothetical protein